MSSRAALYGCACFMVVFWWRCVRCGSLFFVCKLVLCEAVNCGIFARFSLNVCIDRRSFLRVPWLFYCFRALPLLRFGHGFFCLVPCNVFLLSPWSFDGICRYGDAILPTPLYAPAAFHLRYALYCIHMRYIVGWSPCCFLWRFLTCFACFMRTITGKTAFR